MEYTTEIYKRDTNHWNIMIRRNGIYYTTISFKTKKSAISVANDEKSLEFYIQKNKRKGLVVS